MKETDCRSFVFFTFWSKRFETTCLAFLHSRNALCKPSWENGTFCLPGCKKSRHMVSNLLKIYKTPIVSFFHLIVLLKEELLNENFCVELISGSECCTNALPKARPSQILHRLKQGEWQSSQGTKQKKSKITAPCLRWWFSHPQKKGIRFQVLTDIIATDIRRLTKITLYEMKSLHPATTQ